MLQVAITGGIACGKSLVGSLLCAEGIPVCDSDLLAHELIRSGSKEYRKLVEHFGDEITGPDGEIDRSVLAGMVFGIPEQMTVLNTILHPGVKRLWRSWMRRVAEKNRIGVVIVPLLYEIGEGRKWDKVICVGAGEDAQRARLADRGLSQIAIDHRLSAQMPVWQKMERADFVIYNGGSLEMLKEQTERILNELLES